METKKAIIVRFFYNTPDGDRVKDYTIPYKTIKLVQSMYLQKIELVNSVLTE
ncbi:MAG: hypothetical protein H6Q69_2567 [Firmicutes bacterium]|nr:hypothetical protein [Bacillota bacterium]